MNEEPPGVDDPRGCLLVILWTLAAEIALAVAIVWLVRR